MSSEDEATYDVVIVGAGPVGEHAADRCRRAGLSTALVEQELAGGECSYWACIPSKTLLRPSQIFVEAQRVPGARGGLNQSVDTRAALDRRNWMVSDWHDDGQVEWINSIGAVLFRGHGKLVGERQVRVVSTAATTLLTARRAVILATGSSAAMPPIDGLAATRCWDNRGATSANEVPKSLVVIGGGAVGVEMAQAWRRLGTADVTILEGGERLISTNEPFASELLTESFRLQGITVVTDAKVVAVARPSDQGDVTVRLEDGRSVTTAELLVATGRRPRTIDIGVETFGLTPGRYVEVANDMTVSSVPGNWLYAIGDVNGRALLTHIGKYQARIVAGTIVGRDIRAESDLYAIPSVIFTDPIIASVGLTEKTATEKGFDVHTVRVATNGVAAAAILGDDVSGSCQLVADKNNHVLIGATFTGPDVGELIHSATIAIVGHVPMTQLYHAVPSFPTLSEVWLELVEKYLEEVGLLSNS